MKSNQSDNKEPHYIESELSRDITLFQLTMMGAGMMIGAGVFVATGIAIGIAGSGAILIAFALNGVIALFSALSMAELASAIPSAGGVYTFIREAFGGVLGFMSGWMNWFALAIAGSLYSITFASYTLHFITFFEFEFLGFIEARPGLYENILAIFIVLLFISVNYRGASETGGSASYIAMAQTITLFVIGLIGVYVAFTQPERMANFSAFVPHGWTNVLAAMGFTYIGFEGYEVITHAGEESVNPKEDIPKAIIYSLLIVITTYLLIGFAVVVGAPIIQGVSITEWFTEMGEIGVAESIGNLFPLGGLFITLAAIFASTSALNATTYSATRVAFALGREKELPEFLSKISEKRRVPHIALLVTGFIIIPVAILFPIKDVASSTDIMFLLLFLLVNVSVIKIRRDKGEELDYSFVMPLFPYIPVIAIIAQAALSYKLFDVSPLAWFTTIFWLVLGIIIYLLYSRSRIKERAKKEEVSPIIEERRAPQFFDYNVMIPVANVNNASTLVRYGEKMADLKKGGINLISIVALPEQTPMKEAERFSKGKRELLKKSQNMLKKEVPVNSILRVGRNVARAITSSAKEREADLLVLGWKGEIKRHHYEMGRNLDNIIEAAPCDCMVVKPGETENLDDSQINNILLPTNGGVHSELSAEIARIMAESFKAKVTILNVNTGESTKQQIEKRLENVMKIFESDSSQLKIVENDNIVEGILKEANAKKEDEDDIEYDLVIIGSTEEGFFQQLLFGKISEKVAAGCEKTLILAKKNMGIKSISRKWLGRRDYLKFDGVEEE